MSRRPIIEEVHYSVTRDGSNIVLEVEMTTINFVQEVIDYGHLAGTIGHRPERGTNSIVYDLHPAVARMLRDQLDEALFGLED